MKKSTLGFSVIFSLLLLGIVLAACGSSEDTPTAPPTLQTAATETRAPMATVAAKGMSSTNTDDVLSSNQLTETLNAAPLPGPIENSLVYSGLTNLHRPDRISYPMNPPVGGDHNPAWINCGVYTVTLPSELAVHSMEHGAVWITYLPALPADQIELLKTITKASNYRLLNPNSEQDSPVIATAWGVQLKLQTADDPRLQEFISLYENRKDGPEYGAPCSGAYGEPEK